MGKICLPCPCGPQGLSFPGYQGPTQASSSCMGSVPCLLCPMPGSEQEVGKAIGAGQPGQAVVCFLPGADGMSHMSLRFLFLPHARLFGGEEFSQGPFGQCRYGLAGPCTMAGSRGIQELPETWRTQRQGPGASPMLPQGHTRGLRAWAKIVQAKTGQDKHLAKSRNREAALPSERLGLFFALTEQLTRPGGSPQDPCQGAFHV